MLHCSAGIRYRKIATLAKVKQSERKHNKAEGHERAQQNRTQTRRKEGDMNRTAGQVARKVRESRLKVL